jgi:hypothetical protein
MGAQPAAPGGAAPAGGGANPLANLPPQVQQAIMAKLTAQKAM